MIWSPTLMPEGSVQSVAKSIRCATQYFNSLNSEWRTYQPDSDELAKIGLVPDDYGWTNATNQMIWSPTLMPEGSVQSVAKSIRSASQL